MLKTEVATGGNSLHNPNGDMCMKSETIRSAFKLDFRNKAEPNWVVP
jgi:hypothetical protein